MSKKLSSALALLILVAGASPALAHVTVQPNEAVVGSFSRFVVRVPNERPDASTVRVEVEFPPLAFVSFQPKDGWQRDVEEEAFDEPIEVFGNEITEGVTSVTWRGGEIGPGEFEEFGFSARMPDEPGELEFRASQHYDSGEVVEWTGPADGEEPAARVAVYDIGAGEDEGELAVLARVQENVAADVATGEETASDDASPWPLIMSLVALVLASAAVILAVRKPERDAGE